MDGGQTIQDGLDAVVPADLMVLNNGLENAQILLHNLKALIVGEVLLKQNPVTL